MLITVKRAIAKLPPLKRLITQRDAALSSAAKVKAQSAQIQSSLSRAERAVEEWQAVAGRAQSYAAELSRQLETVQSGQREYGKRCFSHWGEDQILAFLFKDLSHGRYLDIGCYHPELVSNTKLLHDKGWSGVNIDPNPFMIDLFKTKRPFDSNLCMAVASERQELDFFFFNEWASSNTLSESFAEKITAGQDIRVQKRMKVQAAPLRDIMSEHFKDAPPEFLNIDVEDLDVDVLLSNDWMRFRPKVVAVEDIDCSLSSSEKTPVTKTLEQNGYVFFSRTIYTSFFIEAGYNQKYWGFK